MRSGSWRSLKEQLGGLLALTLFELVAGLVLLAHGEVVLNHPSVLALLPGLMGLRGDVYGALAFRLVTALYMGTAEARLATRHNLTNAMAALVVSVVASSAVGAVTYVVAAVSGLRGFDLLTLLFVSVVSSLIAFALVVPASTAAIVYSWKRGLDPRNFSSPLISALGDVVTPIVVFAAMDLATASPALKLVALTIAHAAAALIAVLHWGELMRGAVRENLPVSVLAASLSCVGGSFIAVRAREAVSTALLASVPALNAVVGASAGTLANRLSVSIRLGRELKGEVTATTIGSLTSLLAVSTLLLLVPCTTTSVTASEALALWLAMYVTCSAGYLALSAVSYSVVSLSFKRGLDPDNVVFPIVSTAGDLIAPLILSTIIGFTIA